MDVSEEFKPPSKYGQPYNYPLPQSRRDPWTTLLKPLQDKDRARCTAWKDEVEHLLIFAGLFSAVITAFLVESYKTLQQNPEDVTVVLLSRILANAGGETSANTTIPHFTPTASNVRINIYWFLSLVLNLATAVVGIVSLQWLREYQRPGPDLPPQLAYSLFHMLAASIERWYLPQIFMILPLLLQFALVLFAVGVVEFLWQINRSVAIPVVIIILFTLLFLGVTTILPTAQDISLFLTRWRKGIIPRFQCPYMSPQSWAFHRFTVYLLHAMIKLKVFFVHLDNGRKFHAATVVSDKRPQFQDLPKAVEVVFRLEKGDSWFDHGIGWLYQRDIDFMLADQDPSFRDLASESFINVPPPMLDAVIGLKAALDSQSLKTNDEIFAIEDCIQKLSDFAKNSAESAWSTVYLQYLHQLADRPSIQAQDIVTEDHLCHSFSHDYDSKGPIDLRRHRLEMTLRLVERSFATVQQECLSAGITCRIMETLHQGVCDFTGAEQYLLGTLKRFFKTASEFHPSEEEVGRITYTSVATKVFLKVSGRILASVSSTTQYHDLHDSIFETIVTHLRSALDHHPHSFQTPAADYLFYTAALYVRDFLDSQETLAITLTDNTRTLMATLFEYHERTERRMDLEKCLEFNSEWHWSNPSHSLPALTKRQGIVYQSNDFNISSRLGTSDPRPAFVEKVDLVERWPSSGISQGSSAVSAIAKESYSDIPSEAAPATTSVSGVQRTLSFFRGFGTSRVDSTASQQRRSQDAIVDIVPQDFLNSLAVQDADAE